MEESSQSLQEDDKFSGTGTLKELDSKFEEDQDNFLKFQKKSDIELNSQLGFESSDEYKESKAESEIIYPYGEGYTPISSELITNKKKKLGIINLFWPSGLDDKLSSNSLKLLPTSYKCNSRKEKLLLLYAENFRRQYHVKFPTKRPLLLAAENECGVQKMVSTTVRPTWIRYPELHTWQGCAKFVSDHIVYQPLECPHLMPEQVASGTTVLRRQSGHCFELSTLLTGYLVAAGYDAYVVSGYASQDYCQNNLVRTECPHVPDTSEKPEEEAPQPTGKYAVREPRELKSKFILMMEQREKDKEEKERLRQVEEERLRILELEKPPHDPLYWWGVHSWVMLLPGKREVEAVVLIHPGSGVATSPQDPLYLGVESVWNHKNYWVNVQTCSGCKDLQFDLRDTACWEHLLPGEPWEWQEVGRDVDHDLRDSVLLERHLDMPASWVLRLDIPHHRYEQRYPLGQKCTKYKKAYVEEFAPYLHEDGLVRRVTTYEDYDCQNAQVIYEMFEHREDCLTRTVRYLKPEKIIDKYKKGRQDALMRQTKFVEENKRLMEMYHQVRYDDLKTLSLTPASMEEHFEGREDRLYHRYVAFDPRSKSTTKWITANSMIRRNVSKVVEYFHRNPELVADRDIARREFDLANEKIYINYHYADDKITAGTRVFVKPPVQEQGDRLKFDTKLTSGYVVDTTAPPLKKMELFWLLEECLQAEKQALKHIRDMEEEISQILKNLAIETSQPKLKISIFDQERNTDAKERMKSHEQELKEETVREVEAETDYLALYLVRFGDKPLSTQNIMEVRQYCLNEYKQLLVDRANRMQHRFDKVSEELQGKHVWYENLGVSITAEQEEDYLDGVRRLAFRLHTLELRLMRHRDLAPGRYAALETWLNNDPRLQPSDLH